MSDKTLTKKIEQVMAIKALAGLLDDVTPEQKLSFNDAVSGKSHELRSRHEHIERTRSRS